MDQGRKWRLLSHLKQGWEIMRGQNSLVSIITTKEANLSLGGQLHRTFGTLLSPFKGYHHWSSPPAPRPPPSPDPILFPYTDNHWDTPQELLKLIAIEATPSFPPPLCSRQVSPSWEMIAIICWMQKWPPWRERCPHAKLLRFKRFHIGQSWTSQQ